MTTNAFTTLFLIFLLFSLAARTALILRQIRHVAAHRDAVPAAFSATITPAAHAKAADYTCARARLGLIDVAVGALFVLLMTLGGGLDALYRLLGGWLAPGGLWHGIALMAALMVAGWAVDLPFSLYRTFVIEKRYGFSRMTPRLFVADLLRGLLLAVVIGLPVLAAVLWLMADMGERWWLWVWLFWIGFNLLAMLIWPSFIAPLFNKFTPLADQDLKSRVEQLLARCGFHAKGLFVMDGSKRSAHGNAYFTGLGASKRIVFFDTLLEKLQPQEIEAVLAHELGHFHHRHVWKRLLMVSAMSLGILWLLAWLMTQPWFFAGLGMTQQGTAVALALLSLVLPAFLFPFGPLMNYWSRRDEFQADRYAARQTRAADLVSALVKLYRDNAATLTPDPLYSQCFDSHPPAAIRIAQLQLQAETPA